MKFGLNRRQLAAGASVTALSGMLPIKTRAASFSWRVDSKVEVAGHNPQTSGGPVAASGGSALLTVYVGEGGKNLWYSYTGPSFIWQGNQPIKDPKSGNIITSDGRPALSYVETEGYFLLVIPSQGVFETWKYPFGNWSMVDFHEDVTELKFSEPALGDGGDRTHLLICDNNGNLWWYSMDHQGKGWVNQQRVASGKSPSITSIGDTLHALYWDTDQKAFVKLTLPHGASSWQSNRIILTGKTPDRGAAMVSLNGQLYVVYTAGSKNLQCAILNADYSLGIPQPIAPKGQTSATDAAPAVATLQNSLVLLHKGQSSKDLWFSVNN